MPTCRPHFRKAHEHQLTYFAFDLLHLDGHNPRNLPLRERKALLAEVLTHADPHVLRFSEHLESDGPTIFHNACKLRAEGIVSKRAAAKYTAGRSSDWVKCKCLHEQEFVIGGYTLPGAGHTGMKGVGALLLGYYDGIRFIYAGRVGTGFTQKTHKLLHDKLQPLKQTACPFASVPAEARRGAIWVKPKLVAQVRFATWTADNLVRQAAFLGLRDDKPAADVTRETSAPTPKSSKPANARVPHSSRSDGWDVKTPPATKAAHHTALTHPIAAKVSQPATSNLQPPTSPPIRLTHPAKILDPESGLTKQALADYYFAVASRMLPHIADRPLSLVRCPEGSAKPCFFQKHVNSMLPAGIGSVDVPDKKTGVIEPYITLTGKSARPKPSPRSRSSASSKSIPGARATTISNTPTASSSTSTPMSPSPGPPSPPPPPRSAPACASSASPASSRPPAAKASTSSSPSSPNSTGPPPKTSRTASSSPWRKRTPASTSPR